MLSAGEQGLPVVLDAVVLLNKGDGIPEDLGGIGVRAGLVVDHGHGNGEIRQTKAAALEHGGGLAGVAGHIGGQNSAAHNGEIVVDGNAGLRRAAGADVSGQAEGLGHIDVVGLQVLVDVTDDELRQCLDGDGNQAGEASHKQGRHDLVHGNDVVAVPSAAQTLVVGQDQGDLFREAADDTVHIHVGDLQFVLPVALKQPVNKGEGAQIGTHPTVLPEALEDRHRGGGHHFPHGQQVVQPGGVVHKGILHTAPLPVAGDTGLILIAAAKTALAVGCLPLGVKAFQLFIDHADDGICPLLQYHGHTSLWPSFLISRLSTKAWKRVRS